jgi:uncharacterized protein (TIGR04540 family)
VEIKMFYRTQRELADVINQLINAYWNDEISEELMIKYISSLYANNPSKIIKNDDFTTILKQQCGKRRLEVVRRILDLDLK